VGVEGTWQRNFTHEAHCLYKEEQYLMMADGNR
jgi:hypothetical protein